MYEDGGYVWSEGDYTPHNPWGFGVNPWRVIIEEGEVRNELDLTTEAVLTPVIIDDELPLSNLTGEKLTSFL